MKLSDNIQQWYIDVIYADEDTSSNTGRITYEAGKIICIDQPDTGTNEAYEIYFEVNPSEREYYILTDEGYVYNEESN